MASRLTHCATAPRRAGPRDVLDAPALPEEMATLVAELKVSVCAQPQGSTELERRLGRWLARLLLNAVD